MDKSADGERIIIGLRVPGIFKFMALFSLGLSVWAFYPAPQPGAELQNAAAFVVTMTALLALIFAINLDGRVSYTSEGFFIRPSGWRPLVGLAKEHFVQFDEIRKITPGFARGGQLGGQDWLMFGLLNIHTVDERQDEDELVLFQVFLNRQQLVRVLRMLADSRPGIIEQHVVELLESGV